MDLQGTNTNSLQFCVFWVHFCILSPFTGWCWYSWPAWYHLRWIISSLKVQTLHIGRARYLYRTAVWCSSSFFLHFSEAAEVNTRKPHKWLFKQKSSYACKHSLSLLTICWLFLKWFEMKSQQLKRWSRNCCFVQNWVFCIQSIKIFSETQTSKQAGKTFLFFKKKDSNLFHRKRQKCRNGLMLAVPNVFSLHF